LFQPIPLRTTSVPAYITLDASAILSFFKKKGESKMTISENRNRIFDKIFFTNKKVMMKNGKKENVKKKSL
jgi:hypothetical protein